MLPVTLILPVTFKLDWYERLFASKLPAMVYNCTLEPASIPTCAFPGAALLIWLFFILVTATVFSNYKVFTAIYNLLS
jgi:hypothetical protein